jgi:hypothetical protein
MSKRKPKRKPPALRPPPLSGLDKTIYYTLFVLLPVLLFCAAFLYIKLTRAIAYADPTVLSSESRASVFWVFPFLIAALLGGWIPIANALTNKQPIFGKKGIRYGSPGHAPVYPLFGSDRTKSYIRPSERRYRRFMRRLAVGILAVTFLLTPLSLCGRNSLREDMSITVYSVFNREVREYEREDIETVTFNAYHTSKGGWQLRAEIRTLDGRRYDFGGDIDTLLYIKRHVPASSVRYQGEEYLETLIRRRRCNAVEAAKVRALFGK